MPTDTFGALLKLEGIAESVYENGRIWEVAESFVSNVFPYLQIQPKVGYDAFELSEKPIKGLEKFWTDIEDISNSSFSLEEKALLSRDYSAAEIFLGNISGMQYKVEEKKTDEEKEKLVLKLILGEKLEKQQLEKLAKIVLNSISDGACKITLANYIRANYKINLSNKSVIEVISTHERSKKYPEIAGELAPLYAILNALVRNDFGYKTLDELMVSL